MPRVSVLVPTYNGAKFLAETIQSVLDQTFTDFELLIVDDCSTDNSLEIARGFSDPRIKVFENSVNLGNGGSRNRLISLAQGEFCAMLDHDDLCLPDRLETQVNFLDTHLDVDLCGGGIDFIDENGAKKIQPYPYRVQELQHPYLKVMTLFYCCVIQVTIMFRRVRFLDSGVQYENGGADDMNMYCRAINHLRFHNIGKCLVLYRVWSGQFSAKQRTKQAEHAIKALKYTYHTTLGIDIDSDQERALLIVEDGTRCPNEFRKSYYRLLLQIWNRNLKLKVYDTYELYRAIIWYYSINRSPDNSNLRNSLQKRIFKWRLKISRLLAN